MVRMDHSLQTGGRASLACGGLQVQSAPWPREAGVSLIPNSVSLCRWAGGAPTIRMFGGCPAWLSQLCVLSPSTQSSLKGRARPSFHKSGSPDCMSRGCSCPEAPAFLNLEAQCVCLILLCAEAGVPTRQGTGEQSCPPPAPASGQ